jgi:hypothetical protein
MPKTPYDYDALYRAIGKTVVAFQSLEYTLSDGLCNMMKLKDEDHQNIIGASMSFRQKVDLFAALQRRLINEELIPLCRTACTFFNASEDFRNSVVHTHYSMAIGKSGKIGRWAGEKASIRGGKGVKHNKKMIKLAIIEEGSQIISDLGWRAMTYRIIQGTNPDLKQTLERGITRLKRRLY